MQSTKEMVKGHGLFSHILTYITPNTYYADSITDLVRNQDKIKLTDRPILFFYGMGLVVVNNCYYNPMEQGVAVLSDLDSELEINVARFIGDLPQSRTNIRKVLLKYSIKSNLPILRKYNQSP